MLLFMNSLWTIYEDCTSIMRCHLRSTTQRIIKKHIESYQRISKLAITGAIREPRQEKWYKELGLKSFKRWCLFRRRKVFLVTYYLILFQTKFFSITCVVVIPRELHGAKLVTSKGFSSYTTTVWKCLDMKFRHPK